MTNFQKDIHAFKIINFKNTALSVAKRQSKFNDLYYSSIPLDNLKAENMLIDLMISGKHIIQNEINNQGKY
jgi:hypothetical protein